MTHYFAGRPGWPRPSVPSSAQIGDTIEDESGWWQIEDLRDGEAVLVGRDGEEIVVTVEAP